MPHGESWFSFLPFYESLEHAMSEAFPPSYLEHNPHIGVQHVIAFAVVVLFLIGVALYVNRRLKNTEDNILPEGKVTFYGFIEMIVGATYKMSADLMGPKAAKYFLPLIGACALVIFFSNALGLIPGFLPPTDNLNTTFAMAMVIFVVTHIYGVKEQGVREVLLALLWAQGALVDRLVHQPADVWHRDHQPHRSPDHTGDSSHGQHDGRPPRAWHLRHHVCDHGPEVLAGARGLLPVGLPGHHRPDFGLLFAVGDLHHPCDSTRRRTLSFPLGREA